MKLEEYQNMVNEGSLKRFKVYVSGQSEPLILLGKNEKDVKQTAYAMIQNSSVRVKKVVREGLNEWKTDNHASDVMRMEDAIDAFLNSDAYKDLIRGQWDLKGKGDDKKVKNLLKKITPMLEKSGKLLQILYNEVL
tara:strand:+ start:138 stop:545 length:408 start_codon:yes stop_codon:yes gene_type:complete